MSWKVYDKTGNTVRCTLKSLEYNGTWMGACFVTSTLKSAVPILFEIGDYVMYRGEKFEINYDPTALKKAARKTSGEAFVYDNVKFNGAGDELTRCDFLDYVKSDNQIHFTSLPKFSFFASSIQDLADRVQVNLDRIYTGVQKWTVVVHPEYVSTTNVNIDVNNIKVWGALELFNSKFGANFIIRGRTITIGTAGIAADNIFRYGRGNGLYEIQRTADADQQIITRLRAYGSTRNMPNRYYNKISNSSLANYLPNNMAVENLMLPDFPKTTLDPYIDSKNIAVLGVREGSVYFDGTGDLEEICPSMEGMTAKQLEDAGIHVSLDAGDNGNLDEVSDAEQLTDDGTMDNLKDGEDIPPFTITLKDIGFDINDYLTSETATISMKNGMCGGRDFEITKCEKKGNKYILTCNRIYDEGLKLYFPYKDYNIRGGDKFVLLYIDMPDVYIQAASQRLLAAAKKYLAKNDYVHYSYEPKVDDIFMARQHDEAIARGEVSIHDTLKEGDLMLFTDTDLGIDGSIIIDTLIIKEGEGIIPQYTITLKDEKTVGTLEKIQNQIDSIVSGGQGSGGYNSNQIKSLIKSFGSSFFLSKDISDTANGLITFLKGIIVKSYLKIGEFITGVSGGYIDEKGNLEMESGVFRKRLFVPEIAYNRTTYFKGRMVNSPGGGCTVLSYVDNGDGTYTITPDLTDADGLSQFVDDILTTYFVTKNSEGKLNGFEEMKFRVTAADYTAKKFTVIPRPGHSDWKPAEQMVLAQTGNFTDPERQTYILIDSVNGNNCITFFDNANTWDPEPAQMKSWFGKKKGMTVAGINADNYSAVLQDIIMTGLIFQVDEITGQTVRVPLDKGEWVSGKYAYYDRVSHNGALWLCVDDNGTTTEPSDDNPAWLKQVAEGTAGATGPQGVPGTPGKDGITYYTWIRYADNAQGGGISNNPTGKTYIGFAYNKTTAVESNNPSDYTWSEIKGEQGVPGVAGADGKTYYTWIAYSDNADGTGMYQQPNDNTKYIGIAVNKETVTESSNPSDYTWSLFKGKDGADGLSVVGGGHWESSKVPYKANTMVTLANCVFLSKVETSNPPIRILRVKGGNFLRKKDGGYYLAGKPADWEVNEDWDMLLDGRELKGESITFLGEFATAPANPKNGDSYRNTTDRATYIYQDGRWQLMISDGKDGKGYEYIYTRGNIIDNTPEKPDSQQKDGYVPEGWTDNYLGTDADHQVEWGCTRFKENGVWSEFSTPAVVHRWSKDGENAIMADFDNEMVNAALTSDGKVVSSQTWNTTVSMWYGTEKLTLDSITCTPDTNLLCATDKNTGVVTISVSAGATLAATNTVKITIRATKNGQQYSRDLSFTVAGVRGGADGSDAVLYSIIVSATSVSKDKNGNYSVSSVSCYRQKSVGGVISTTTDGTLKYSIDGGTETTINNNTAISSGNFTKTLKFIFYVNDQIVDVETVPMLSDGKDGADGESITAAGHWESANTPYAKNSTVSFAGGSYLSKVKTSNPPIRIARFKNGSYRRKKDGGYILAGRSANRTVHADWQEMVAPVGPSASYWLDSPVSVINFTSTGTPSPSGFLVTCKQNVAGNVSTCSTLYLAARKYNGSWLAHVGATLSNQISVPATAGYTQFAVRAYKSASDANAWNNNFVAEKGVGVANDGAIGATGATGASPRDMGVFQSGTSYVWNASYRDKIIYKFNGVYYNFLVRNYGASVTAAPTSVNGDSNWEAMQKFVNIATDTLFATGANICGFMFTYKGMDANGIPFGDIKSQKSTNGVPNLILNSESGYIHGINMDIEGGRIGPFSIASGMLSSKILYENETNKYVGFNLSAGQIEFYNERTFANVRIGGNTQFVTIEGIKYDAGIDIQSPNVMIGMHIKTPSIPLFVEGGNIFLHPNNDSYVSLRGIVGNWRNISVKASLNNNDDNVMFINRDNIEVTLPPDVPGHTIYFKRMSGGVRLTGGRILPAPGGQEVSYIDLDFASGFIKCMGNYWVMFYCG